MYMTIITPRIAIIALCLMSLSFAPGSAQAAEDTDPACILIVSTPRGYDVYEGTRDVEIRSGERIILAWIGLRASEAVDRDNRPIPNVGLKLLTAEGSGEYSFTFSEGRNKATCSVSLELSGATGASAPRENGESRATGGSVSVSPIPLLSGGTASAGASVPVAYIKVLNNSREAATIEGFTLVQNGSADTDVVIGFATNDDKGGSRATIGGNEGNTPFDDGEAFVPLEDTLVAGEFRIYTIKALLSRLFGSDAGRTLMLDVDSIRTNGADVFGAFPIRGTVWTLSAF
ncbi:MAG TPA: hypothetical protein VFY28_02685 [Candidatus Paceibacterota bacterium]|nr:hypothetical protein [Candidatus Paceibacterota bacterium]